MSSQKKNNAKVRRDEHTSTHTRAQPLHSIQASPRAQPQSSARAQPQATDMPTPLPSPNQIRATHERAKHKQPLEPHGHTRHERGEPGAEYKTHSTHELIPTTPPTQTTPSPSTTSLRRTQPTTGRAPLQHQRAKRHGRQESHTPPRGDAA